MQTYLQIVISTILGKNYCEIVVPFINLLNLPGILDIAAASAIKKKLIIKSTFDDKEYALFSDFTLEDKKGKVEGVNTLLEVLMSYNITYNKIILYVCTF